MQKKMIALAVAGLVSGAAFAQSNVTVFGIMDMGYQYAWDNYDSKTKSQSAIKAGGHDGSRVGFRGTEDLGNGLKANFEMVAGFDADTGVSYGDSTGNSTVSKRLMSEGAYVGLSGASWGEVKAGYIGTFLDDNTGVDVSGRHGIASTGALYDSGKWNNFVAYYSPNWSGFQVKAGFSSNINGQDNVPFQNSTVSRLTTNMRGYSVAASYANGGLKLGAAYAYYTPQDVSKTIAAASTDNGYEWNAGISYDFKVVAVSLFGAKNVNSTPGGTPSFGYSAADVDHRNFVALGLAVPLGANDIIKLGYGQAKTYGGTAFPNETDKARAWGVVYFHNLSKRTNLYAMYGNVDSDNEVYSVTNGYQQAVNVGVRHLF